MPLYHIVYNMTHIQFFIFDLEPQFAILAKIPIGRPTQS